MLTPAESGMFQPQAEPGLEALVRQYLMNQPMTQSSSPVPGVGMEPQGQQRLESLLLRLLFQNRGVTEADQQMMDKTPQISLAMRNF